MRLIALLAAGFLAANALARDAASTATPELQFLLPADAQVVKTNDVVTLHDAAVKIPRLVIKTGDMTVHLWTLRPGIASNIVDASALAPVLIQSEFRNFKPAATNQLTVAGAPALHLLGPGNEADDGDPGNAEVVLFTVNGRVFAACIHGEFDDAARERPAMLKFLQTAAASK